MPELHSLCLSLRWGFATGSGGGEPSVRLPGSPASLALLPLRWLLITGHGVFLALVAIAIGLVIWLRPPLRREEGIDCTGYNVHCNE